MSRLLLPVLVVAAALVLVAPAAADEPTKLTTHLSLGPLVDDETCSFPFTVTVDRPRTTLTFANGDLERHTDLEVVSSANGHTLDEHDVFDVFVDHQAPAS